MGLVRAMALLGLVALVSGRGWAAEDAMERPESVCIPCHQSMEGDIARPVVLWETSIHRKMGNSCEGCHGGDPSDAARAMDPKAGFIGAPEPAQVAAFCGRCHVGVKENYLKSVHYRASLQGKGPTCTTCHHSHDVQKASFDLIEESLCVRCHSFENAQKIKRAFVSAEVALQNEKENLRYTAQRGAPVRRQEEKLFALRNSLHQMTHTLDLPGIEKKTESVLKELEGINQEVDVFKKKIHRRWVMGSLVGGFLVLLIVVLYRLLKTYESDEGDR